MIGKEKKERKKERARDTEIMGFFGGGVDRLGSEPTLDTEEVPSDCRHCVEEIGCIRGKLVSGARSRGL
ncbi:hypothetical protein WN51_13642 [Melipona quadrifasciata]|uniref:Uncharacterized protein n=1 Tax=Melipona quadrifasciata TaxID=166423 RepID=A0A0M9A222_9HYME|nr:hypothetical protein WN51_13642 [Melipona quadrifasciata]